MEIIPDEIWIHIVRYLETPCNFFLVNKYTFSLAKYQKNTNKKLIKNIIQNGYLDIQVYF